MPLVEVKVDTPSSATVSSPHTIPFSINLTNTNHGNYPLYFKSLAARFETNVNIPTEIQIATTNLHHDAKYTTIQFPLSGTLSTKPSYHYHADIHLGDVACQSIVQGNIIFKKSGNVQLPSHFTMLLLIDSEYM